MPKEFESAYSKTRKSMGYKDGPTPSKAREMLHDGTANGKSLTKKQRGYFGAVASGSKKKKNG